MRTCPVRGSTRPFPASATRVAATKTARGRSVRTGQAAPPAQVPTRHSWVGGHEVEGRGGHRTVENPSDGQAFAQTSLLDAGQAGDALAAAFRAFPAWSRSGVRDRSRALQRLREALVAEADEIARLVEREQGKPFAEVHAAEILPSLEALKHLAGHAEDVLREDPVEGQLLLLAHKEARLVYEPYGVVLAITPVC